MWNCCKNLPKLLTEAGCRQATLQARCAFWHPTWSSLSGSCPSPRVGRMLDGGLCQAPPQKNQQTQGPKKIQLSQEREWGQLAEGAGWWSESTEMGRRPEVAGTGDLGPMQAEFPTEPVSYTRAGTAACFPGPREVPCAPEPAHFGPEIHRRVVNLVLNGGGGLRQASSAMSHPSAPQGSPPPLGRRTAAISGWHLARSCPHWLPPRSRASCVSVRSVSSVMCSTRTDGAGSSLTFGWLVLSRGMFC